MLGRIGFVVSLVVLVFITSGCIVAIGSGGHNHPKDRPGVETETAIAEIDAAGRLFSDSDKTAVYKGIAERPNLCGKVQAYLVKESCRHIFSDASREEVMTALIANPCFSEEGKRAVLSNLNHLFSDSRKRRVLEAINEREKQTVVLGTEVTVETTGVVPE